MPKRNVELLTKVRDLIKTEPAKLDMGLWGTMPTDVIKFKNGFAKVSCGTTACIAGWAVQLSGDQLLVREEDLCTGWETDETIDVEHCVARNGRSFLIDDRAQKLLGLTADEAEALFMCTDSQAVEYLDLLISGGDLVEYDEHYYDGEDEDEDEY